MIKIRIENVVATTALGKEFDIRSLSAALEGAQYNPENFPGIVYRIKAPKTAMLIFRSGKVVCTGAKSLDEVRMAIDVLVKQIEAAGIAETKKPEIIVQNIVASADLGCVLNLNTIALSLGLERVEYEPEQFPGLVYRIDEPKVVALLFGSGKIVLTGAKKTDDIYAAVKRIHDDLNAGGLLARQ